VESHSLLPTVPRRPPPPLAGPAVEPLGLCYADIRSTVSVPSDGNCLFTSVSVSKWATTAPAPALRRAAVLFVLRNWAHFKESVVLPGLVRRPTPAEYAQHMRRDGACAAEIEVQALARILNVIIAVYTPDGKHVYRPFGRPQQTIFLKFFAQCEGHYESFQPRSRPERPTRPAPVSRLPPAGPLHLEAASTPSCDKAVRAPPVPKQAVQSVPPVTDPSTATSGGWSRVSPRRVPGCYVVSPVAAPPLRLSKPLRGIAAQGPGA